VGTVTNTLYSTGIYIVLRSPCSRQPLFVFWRVTLTLTLTPSHDTLTPTLDTLALTLHPDSALEICLKIFEWKTLTLLPHSLTDLKSVQSDKPINAAERILVLRRHALTLHGGALYHLAMLSDISMGCS
jgi:hypothetical protein